MALIRELSRKFSLKRDALVRPRHGKVSYAQCGEDLIVDFILRDGLQMQKVLYLDIGAYHPYRLSNTYLFYQQGQSGVCIEPDPVLFDEFKRVRGRDVCLNVGVGTENSGAERADFYLMTSSSLNTFSKEDAERYQSYGNQKIEKVIQVPLLTVNEIIEKHLSSCPNFVSLDVEGLDLPVLQTFDFSAHRPEVFCIETLTYAEDKSEKKLTEIIELMISRDYFVWADTYINTIFVDKKMWQARP
jgi:FkbM family methyltransferase